MRALVIVCERKRERQTDRQTDGQSDGRRAGGGADGRTDRRTDRPTDRQTDRYFIGNLLIKIDQLSSNTLMLLNTLKLLFMPMSQGEKECAARPLAYRASALPTELSGPLTQVLPSD